MCDEATRGFCERLGRRIRQRRRILGLTQEKVACGVGVRFQQVQKWESGCNQLSAYRLLQVAAVLETTAARLLEGLEAAPEGGWRPIESAPRDGTVIMLSRPFWTVPFVGRWTTSKHGEGWHDDNVDEGPLLSPMTHWQPLPPPPTVSREGA